MKEQSLHGMWTLLTDENDTNITSGLYKSPLFGVPFRVPGTTCENEIGEPSPTFTQMTKESVRSLRQKFEYTGVIWLERELTIPDEWQDKTVVLYMERVMWFSDVWIDGEKIMRQTDSLSTPHEYELGNLSCGTHRLTVRIDNRNQYNIDTMASGYTNDTQSIWCGMIGEVKLIAYDAYSIRHVDVYPDITKNQIKVRVTIQTPLTSPNSSEPVKLTLCVCGKQTHEYDTILHHTRQIKEFIYPIADYETWDEFHPTLYTLSTTLTTDSNSHTVSTEFGMREIHTDGRHFILNGKRIFLRGTLDCCVYPKTGYPPTDLEHWLSVCRTAKEYGLNHIRCHSWCPPDNAFRAADMVGIYLTAEMPFWLNVDVCALASGDDAIHRIFYHNEAVRILNTYGNHPSFILFSNGNELLGDFEMLEQITTQIKALDSRHLYTLTSNFDRDVTVADDYFSAFRANTLGIRCQYFHDEIPHSTKLCYNNAIASVNVPTVSFEVGQYCVYPDVREIPKYDKNLVPTNLLSIKEDLEKKGLLHNIGEYVHASGKLAALLYKEDIEAALRTKDMGGIELLGLHDYPGQCTATIGLLNAFWESKDILTSDEFRQFCSPVVPLIKANRIFDTITPFTAELDIADFGEKPLIDPTFVLEFICDDKTLYKLETKEQFVSFPLNFISRAMQIKLKLSILGTTHYNTWDIFVYPPQTPEKNNVLIADSITDDVIEKIENGGKVWLNCNDKTLKNPIQGKFYPVFWSPAYFPSSNPCGFMCDNDHPVFDDFPTQDTSNFQWYRPLDNSVTFNITTVPSEFQPIIEQVPNFFDNTRMSSIFEARVGKADILFSGFDFSIDDKCVSQLECSINKYINSEYFKPKQMLQKDVVTELFI